MIVCPCCGSSVNASKAPLECLPELNVSEQKRIILAELVRAFPRPVGIKALVEALYWNDPDGGPLYADKCVHVHISRLRSLLPESGWTIPSNTGGHGRYGRYRLAPLESLGKETAA